MKVYLTDGNGAERPFVSAILSKGQTGIMDRGYQSHKDFDLLQDENKHFVCRIKAIKINWNLDIIPTWYILNGIAQLLGG